MSNKDLKLKPKNLKVKGASAAWVEQYEAERKAHDEEVKQAVEA